MAANPYRYLPVATIQARLQMYLDEEAEILLAMQNYSMNGVSNSRASLTTVRESIGLLSQALRLATGQARTVATVNTIPLGGFGH